MKSHISARETLREVAKVAKKHGRRKTIITQLKKILELNKKGEWTA